MNRTTKLTEAKQDYKNGIFLSTFKLLLKFSTKQNFNNFVILNNDDQNVTMILLNNFSTKTLLLHIKSLSNFYVSLDLQGSKKIGTGISSKKCSIIPWNANAIRRLIGFRSASNTSRGQWKTPQSNISCFSFRNTARYTK